MRARLTTSKGAEFTEFTFQARKFFAGVPGYARESDTAGGEKVVKDALKWI